MVAEPRHRVDRREMLVDTDWADLLGSEAAELPPGVPVTLLLWARDEAWDSRSSSSSVSPHSARGAGSTPFLMNLSAKLAKHFRAPSATWLSSYLSRVERLATQPGRD